MALGGLAAAYAVLWIGGVFSHIAWGRAPEGTAWTAPAFLALAAAMTLAAGRHRLRLALIAVAGFGVEVLGVHAGVPFGGYEYTEQLGPRFLGVPLVLGCAWLVLVAYVADRVDGLQASKGARVAIGALWLVAFDLVIDPLAANTLGYWRWEQGGAYYGVPFSNFAGWFVTGALLLAVLPGAAKPTARTVAWTGLSIVVFFGLVAAAHGLIIPALVAVTLAGAHTAASMRGRIGRPLTPAGTAKGRDSSG